MSKKKVAWLKVYDAQGEYKASFVYPEDAAVLLSAFGVGAEARNGHAKKNVIWREGFESQSAGESYDFAGNVMHQRTTSEG